MVISSSVKESSAEVASSNISSWGRRKSARAIESLCFSPPETLTPPSPIKVSSPLSALARRFPAAETGSADSTSPVSSVADELCASASSRSGHHRADGRGRLGLRHLLRDQFELLEVRLRARTARIEVGLWCW